MILEENRMEAKKHGNWLILWSVVDCEDEHAVAYFKDPFKAADFALQNCFSGVQMVLYKPEWNVKTKD